MFKHQAKMPLKADSRPPFSQKTENTIIPKDVSGNIGADVEKYQKSAYLKWVETLSEVILNAPNTVISDTSA